MQLKAKIDLCDKEYNQIYTNNQHTMLSKFKTQYNTFIQHSGVDEVDYQKTGLEWCLGNELPFLKDESNELDSFKGGILSDEMGMGKTITMLSLMCVNVVPHTLIVLPPSLISQWCAAIAKCYYTDPVVYHGAKRKHLSDEKILQASVCVTSYSMMRDERFVSLCSNHWNRIIFDEAHYMRNYKTKLSVACLAFCQNHRNSSPRLSTWLLTGTPICNYEEDLMSLCAILGIQNSYITRDNIAVIKKNKLLYRTKKDVGIVMPELVTRNVSVMWDTNSDEYKVSQLFHSQIVEPNKWSNNISETDLEHFNEKPLMKKGLWIRARQACIHPSLLRSYFNSANKLALLNDMNNKEVFTSYAPKYISKKMSAILKTLHEQSIQNPENNRIIFCNYHDEMNILHENIVTYFEKRGSTVPSIELINSKVSKKKRTSILENTKNPAKILILQLSMCAEGLNLQKYNEVYFVSPTFNPSIEQQAIARCYRRGQQKEVYVFKFNMTSLVNHDATDVIDALTEKLPSDLLSSIWEYAKPNTDNFKYRGTYSYSVTSTDEHIANISNNKENIIDTYVR